MDGVTVDGVTVDGVAVEEVLPLLRPRLLLLQLEELADIEDGVAVGEVLLLLLPLLQLPQQVVVVLEDIYLEVV